MEKLLLKLPVLLLFLLLLLLQQQQQAASHSTVEYLPGLRDRLSFPLQTGYVGVGKDEELQLFYYFLESESEPTTDPLLIWLSGGPGCSAATAIVNGIGPLRFVERVYNGSMPSFVLNPHAWTKIASVIFLDQPINTGFSYVTNEAAYKQTDVQAFDYVYEFLRKWLSDHPKYISNPFYMSGNSYAGKMIPVVAQLISNGNTAGKEPFVNLQGYLIGSPGTFRPQEDNYQILFSYGMGLISDELYKSLEKNCGGEYTNIDPNNKGCAIDFRIFKQSDWRKHMKYWANDPKVQEALHIRKGSIGSWVQCNKISSVGSPPNYTLTVDNVVP